MSNYYFVLALHSLRRNFVLTVLMILAIGVGIGASMTILTIFRAMSGDPIPDKSSTLFAVQMDSWGPDAQTDPSYLEPQLTYIDAMALQQAGQAKRQAAMYKTGFVVTPDNRDLKPFSSVARATYADFFEMFAVPFKYGTHWTAEDDRGHANVVVLSAELNDKLFAGANSVGKEIDLDGRNYRILGVLQHWQPEPIFYDLNNGNYGTGDEIFLPFTRAVDLHQLSWGNNNCHKGSSTGWEGRLQSDCVWIQFWAELPTQQDANRYRTYLNNYAAEQQKLGRFNWPPKTRLSNVREWLDINHVVSNEMQIMVLVSFSFLFVCLLNAMGLMLAKFTTRGMEISLRRALGADRFAILLQCLAETGMIGFLGGIFGLGLTVIGLMGCRALLSSEMADLTRFGPVDVMIAILLAVGSTVIAGLYPSWRTAQVQPASMIKAQ